MKNYCKLFGIMALAAMICLSFAACGDDLGNGSGTDGSIGHGSGTDGNIYKKDIDYIKSKLGGNYQLAYEITTYTNGTPRNKDYMAQTRTSYGYYCYDTNIGGSETLYIKNGSVYDCYVYIGSKYEIIGGDLSEADIAELMTILLNSMTSVYVNWKYVTPNGTDTVAARPCTKYTYSDYFTWYDGSSVQLTHNYSIDNETGACLKYTLTASNNAARDDLEYLCTTFKIGGAVLPEYQ